LINHSLSHRHSHNIRGKDLKGLPSNGTDWLIERKPLIKSDCWTGKSICFSRLVPRIVDSNPTGPTRI
jgi:hypothetical protein